MFMFARPCPVLSRSGGSKKFEKGEDNLSPPLSSFIANAHNEIYMTFTRKKAAFWKKYEPIEGAAAPPPPFESASACPVNDHSFVRQRSRTFKVVGGRVALFDVDHIVERFVALVAVVVWRLESDEAKLATQHQQRSVNDRHNESFSVAQRVAHGVQTAVHARRHVASVGGSNADRAVFQPLQCKQAGRSPATSGSATNYRVALKK